MKKAISICFFAVFLLLGTLGLYFLWKPQKPEILADEPMTEETELLQEAETEGRTTESMSIQKAYVYQICEKDGRLVVCGMEKDEVLFETNIQFSNLDETMQERVRSGIHFMNERELYDFLESYSS